jgi:hypothetical protein
MVVVYIFSDTSYSSHLDISTALNFHEFWNAVQQLTVLVRVEEGHCNAVTNEP